MERDGILPKLAFAVGLAIGVTWVVLAVMALRSAARGFAYDRMDWGVGWGLVGILLLTAGTAAVVGTWWHQFRVKRRHEN